MNEIVCDMNDDDFEQMMDDLFTAGWREVDDDGCGGTYEWYDPHECEWCGTGIRRDE